MKCYLQGNDIKNVKGIAYFNGESVVSNEREKFIKDLDSIPLPDYSLVNISDYWGYHSQMNTLLAEKTYAPIMSSRACPYKCIYCHSIFGKIFRKRSPENFIAEMKMLYYEYGVREFHIIDDVFNIDRKRMTIILNMIIDSGMKIRIAFPNALRGDRLTRESILLLKKAGAYMLTFAFETASQRIQKLIRKNLDIEKVVSNVEYASEIGLLTKGYFMLGFPGETVDEIKETVNLAIRSKLDMANFFVVVPFEKTGLSDLAKSMYDDYRKNTYVDYHSDKSFYEEVTGYDITKLQKKAYFRFYNIKRLLILFFKIPRKIYYFYRFFASMSDLIKI